MPVRGRVVGVVWRGALGVAAGAGTALLALGVLAGLGLVLLVCLPVAPLRRRVRRAGAGAVRWLSLVETWRLRRCYPDWAGDTAGLRAGSGPRTVGYLLGHAVVGLLGMVVVGLLLLGAAASAQVLWTWGSGVHDSAFGPAEPGVVVYFLALCAVLAFLGISGVAGVAVLDVALARQLLAPSAEELLERRVSELAASRAEVVDAVNAERRRIERDLHDGVQQRLVALAMLLGRARRQAEPARAGELMQQAHEESQRVLTELQDVA